MKQNFRERVQMLKFTDTVLFIENEVELKNSVEWY